MHPCLSVPDGEKSVETLASSAFSALPRLCGRLVSKIDGLRCEAAAIGVTLSQRCLEIAVNCSVQVKQDPGTSSTASGRRRRGEQYDYPAFIDWSDEKLSEIAY